MQFLKMINTNFLKSYYKYMKNAVSKKYECYIFSALCITSIQLLLFLMFSYNYMIQ